MLKTAGLHHALQVSPVDAGTRLHESQPLPPKMKLGARARRGILLRFIIVEIVLKVCGQNVPAL